MLARRNTHGLPAQKKAHKDKTEEWRKQCVDAGESLVLMNDANKTRVPRKDREANVDLYNGLLNEDDVKTTVDPWGLNPDDFPRTMRHYPIAYNRINVLIGEEAKRTFDWRVYVTNDSAISEKEEEIHGKILSEIQAAANPQETPNFNQQEFEQKLKELNNWKNWNAQDLRERTASHILNHDWGEQRFNITFNHGMKDVLLQGEEIYCADIIGDKPIFRKCDPMQVFFSGTGGSNYIEDADMIVEEVYSTIGQIIDQYHEYLTPDEIDKLEGFSKSGDSIVNYSLEHIERFTVGDTPPATISSPTGASYGYNQEGEVRVLRVVWKSRRKLGELKYYDEEGVPQKDIVDENYKADKSKGETIKWLWVNEWWEGTKIDRDIYVKMRPRPIQFRRMDNLSISGSGYVGTLYGKSLMCYMKPYNYMYDSLAYRLDKALAKYKGPMIEMDFAKIPDGWTPEMWLYYGEEMGYLPIDSFKEGDRGAAMGKLAGSVANTTGREYNPNMGSYIRDNIDLMMYIDNQMRQVVGITPEREGAISNRESVGGIERSVIQSSHSTEQWFLLHEDTKSRALEVYLETAKFAYRGKNMKVQNILDDMSAAILNIDGQQFNEADYGIVIGNSAKIKEVESAIRQLAQAGIQNDKLNFSDLMTIYMSPSIAEMRRKVESSEMESLQRQQQQEQQAIESQNQATQARAQSEQEKRQLEKYKIDTEARVKLLTAQVNLEQDPLEMEKTLAEIDKIKEELRLKQEDLNEKKRHNLATENAPKTT